MTFLRKLDEKKTNTPILLLLLLCLLLAACKSEVYGGLTEEQANLMLSALLKRGVAASKENMGKSGFSILVEEMQMIQALDILRENGLPHDNFRSLGDIFSGQGMIASPTEEEARMAFAISQELSNTFSRIDGVLAARVHVVLGRTNEAANIRIPPSVGVFLRHNPDSQIGTMVSKIRELSAHAVPGLTVENVSVMLTPVRETITVPPPNLTSWQEKYMFPALLGAAVLGILVGIGGMRLTQKNRKNASDA